MKNNKLQSAWERTSGIRGGEVLIGSSAHVRSSTTVKVLLLGALSVIGTALLAHVRIPLPFTPVPLTGQTFGIMLTGLLLGARRGGLSMTAYGLIGLAGLPVFAGGGLGLVHLFGPTGGYLWGSVAGAYVTGLIARGGTSEGRAMSYGRALLATAIGGVVAVYGIGVPHLAIVTGMDWQAAIVAGALPFLVGDMLKAVLAAAIAVRFAPAVDRMLD